MDSHFVVDAVRGREDVPVPDKASPAGVAPPLRRPEPGGDHPGPGAGLGPVEEGAGGVLGAPPGVSVAPATCAIKFVIGKLKLLELQQKKGKKLG